MILGMILAAAVVQAPLAPLHRGVWSSVRYSRESGDADGLELIVPSSDAATIRLTVCEGGCTPSVSVPIRRYAAGFAFDYAEDVTDQDGRPSTLPVRHAQARLDGDVLLVVWLHEDVVDVLRRRARPTTTPRETPVLVKRADRS